MEIPSPQPTLLAHIGHVCEYLSAIFGIFGTALMSRRFFPQVLRGMIFSAAYPFMLPFRQGHRVRQYFIFKARLTEDAQDSLADVTLGTNLIFWGFFLQLLALILK